MPVRRQAIQIKFDLKINFKMSSAKSPPFVSASMCQLWAGCDTSYYLIGHSQWYNLVQRIWIWKYHWPKKLRRKHDRICGQQCACWSPFTLWRIWVCKMSKFESRCHLGYIPTNGAISVNSLDPLWPGDAMWHHVNWSTLVQRMVCCLAESNYYRDLSGRIIVEAL